MLPDPCSGRAGAVHPPLRPPFWPLFCCSLCLGVPGPWEAPPPGTDRCSAHHAHPGPVGPWGGSVRVTPGWVVSDPAWFSGAEHLLPSVGRPLWIQDVGSSETKVSAPQGWVACPSLTGAGCKGDSGTLPASCPPRLLPSSPLGSPPTPRGSATPVEFFCDSQRWGSWRDGEQGQHPGAAAGGLCMELPAPSLLDVQVPPHPSFCTAETSRSCKLPPAPHRGTSHHTEAAEGTMPCPRQARSSPGWPKGLSHLQAALVQSGRWRLGLGAFPAGLALGRVCRSPGQWDSLVKAADWAGGPLRALPFVLGHRNEGGRCSALS